MQGRGSLLLPLGTNSSGVQGQVYSQAALSGNKAVLWAGPYPILEARGQSPSTQIRWRQTLEVPTVWQEQS